MYADNLVINYGIIYDNIGRYIKKYTCVNELWLLSVLSFTYRVVIYRNIDYFGNGIRKIDGINRSEKSYLRQKCAC